jgi:hypothetical protein
VINISPDGTMLASGDQDQVGHLWDVDQGKRLRSLTGLRNLFRGVFSPNGRILAATTVLNGAVQTSLWDAATGKVMSKLAGPCLHPAFSPDGTLVAGSGNDCTMRLWDVATGKEIRAWKMLVGAPADPQLPELAEREQEALSIAFSADGNWAYQSDVAAGEITQLFEELRAAEIREAMAQVEWKNHQRQIKQAEEIEQFLTDNAKDKMTNLAFYAWMKREVKGLYGHCFQFAFDIARKAERALQEELGDPNLSFIEYGYLAGKEGLLAGEKLYQDIKRMEMAYVEHNQREYELTKHISLLQVNPVALLQLRATGSCTVTIPEELFDFDCPGHYFRRIKSVAVSIPCVVGTYTSVNCRLTLLKSSIRINTLPGENGYARNGANDSRFSDFFGSVQSVVTSTGQSNSGLFETNLHDERKLPFEWSGVVSQLRLDIPADVRQFDFNTVADVILHLRYTARGGGDEFRKRAVANLQDCIAAGQTAGSIRLFSVRHEFPADWAKFISVKPGGTTTLAPLTITLRPEH